MKPTLPLLTAIAAACLAITTVRADDPAAQIRASVEALANAKAFRRTTITTDLDTDTARTLVAESVQPNLLHVVDEKYERFSDGKSVSFRDRKASSVTAVGGLEQMTFMDFVRAKSGLKGLLEGLKEAHVDGHITFRDLPTTVIAFTMDQNGMVSTGKLWVSDADHLPLKIESETHGETKLPSGEARKINQRNMGSYEYGPSIKIVMP